MKPHERIIVAADVDTAFAALHLWEELRGHVGGIKLGLQLGMSMLLDPHIEERLERAVRSLKAGRKFLSSAKGRIMWDFKLHDIPNTVGGAAGKLSKVEPLYATVHASGGEQAMRKAVSALGGGKVLAVTVLTSVDSDQCVSIFGDEPGQKVAQFAAMAKSVGVRGIVCSPKEAAIVREAGLNPVTPGIRLPEDGTDDQARISTPAGAIEAGAHMLVVGRTITQAKNKVEAAQAVAESIASAL